MPDRRPARARAHTHRSPPVRARRAAQIFNKGALGVFPFPLQLTSLQYFVSAAAVWVLARAAVLESDPLRWQTVRKFWFVSAVFTLAIFSNTKVLHHASVETVIVFRTTVALLTSVGDWLWLGKQLPSTRSWAALLSIVAGAIGYMKSEGGAITPDSLVWGTIYVLVLAFEVSAAAPRPRPASSARPLKLTRVCADGVREARGDGREDVDVDAGVLQQHHLAFLQRAAHLRRAALGAARGGALADRPAGRLDSDAGGIPPLPFPRARLPRTAAAAAADAQSPLASVSVLTPLPPLQVQGLTAPWSSLISLVMLSALGGLGISYAGFGFRSLVSATTFTLAGSAALLSLLPSHFLDSFSPFFARFHRLDERFQRAERGPRTRLSCRPLCPG